MDSEVKHEDEAALFAISEAMDMLKYHEDTRIASALGDAWAHLSQRLAAIARPSAAGDALDIYEGHHENCHAVHPGDRECNCHKAYGFDTADAMHEADQRATAPPVAVSGIELTSGQIAQLAAFAGNEEEPAPEDQTTYVIRHAEKGHSGPGIYAHLDEYPEEGAILLDGIAPPVLLPVAVSDAVDALDGDELYRLLAQVGPVGTFNGKDVIYRSSVLELVKRRIDALTGAQP